MIPSSAGPCYEDALGNRAATQSRTVAVQAMCPVPSFLCADDSCADASVSPAICGIGIEEDLVGRGLHSSTSQLNLSASCGTLWVRAVDRWDITRHKLDTKRLSD